MDKIKAANRVRSEHGSVAVEFALTLPILLLVVGGAVEFGRAFWFYDTLSKATREAARYVSMVKCNPGELSAACDLRLGGSLGGTVVDHAKAMVANAAIAAGVTGFDATKVEVRCDASPCSSNAVVLGSTYVTVAIVNYGITLGQWLPLSYSNNAAGYNLGIQPYTIMRYLGE